MKEILLKIKCGMKEFVVKKCADIFCYNDRRFFLFVAILVSYFVAAITFPTTIRAFSDTYTSSTTWVAPLYVTSVNVEVWGAGGGGGGGVFPGSGGGGGGGGGAYSKKINIPVTSGNSYTVSVGTGGAGGSSGGYVGSAGGDSYFIDVSTVMAKGGGGGLRGASGAGAAGGDATAGVGDTKFSGGHGADGTTVGGGGGGGAGDASNGGDASGQTAGAAGTVGGGVGATGGSTGNASTDNAVPGGAGAGGGTGLNTTGSAGKGGKVVITYVKNITVTVDSGQTKVYGEADPAFTYTVTAGALDPGDSFTGSLARAAGSNVGTYAINQSTLTAGSNYNITFVGADFSITARPITVTAGTNTKTYNATTTAATLPTITVGTLAAGDTATLAETYDTKLVGTGKTLTPTAVIKDAGLVDVTSNYNVTLVNDTTGVITAKELTVAGITANNKVYDGNATSTLSTASAALSGVESGDVVNLSVVTAEGTFDTKNVGTGKTVTVSGLTISGGDAGNYTLTQPTTTANITAKGLTATGVTASNKVYDGGTVATLDTGSASLVGVETGDTVTLNTASAVGAFSTKGIGTGKTVTVSGLALGGVDAGNYTLTQPTTTANITARPITVTATTNTKVYDTNVAAAALPTITTGTLASGESVTLAETYATKTVGTGKTLTPTATIKDAGLVDVTANYNVTLNNDTTGIITAVTLTVTGVTANNKTYDGTTTATLNMGSAALVGVLGSDAVSIVTSGAIGTFDTASVGVGKTVTVSGLALSGVDAVSYVLTQPTTTADITAAPSGGSASVGGGGFPVYDYVSKDIDGDGLLEKAVDMNRKLVDGYEYYSDADGSSRFVYVVDGDNDGKTDFLIDINADGRPDVYWDPNEGVVSKVMRLDADSDITIDYVFDPNGDGKFEKYYDPDIAKIRDYQEVVTTTPPGTQVTTRPVVTEPATRTQAPAQPAEQPSVPALTCQAYLSKNIRWGAVNDTAEVNRLKTFLRDYENAKELVVNGVYDNATISRVVMFQEKYSKDILAPHGLMKGTGSVMGSTIRKINELYCNKPAPVRVITPTVTPPVITSAQCPYFTKNMSPWMRDAEVQKIQQFLKDRGFLSIASTTTYFGYVTTQAVRDFQLKYAEDILKPAGFVRSTGLWFPQTIKKANELMGCK